MPTGAMYFTPLIAVSTCRSPDNSVCTVPVLDKPPLKSYESANGIPIKKFELSPPVQHFLSVPSPVLS